MQCTPNCVEVGNIVKSKKGRIMGISISRTKAIKYVNQSSPKTFKERLKTLAIYYFVFVLMMVANYVLFKNITVLYYNIGAATVGLLVVLLFSWIKRDKEWYNTYFNMAILGCCLSFIFMFFGLSFLLVLVNPVIIYSIGFIIWFVICLLISAIKLKQVEKKDNFNSKKTPSFLVIASGAPGIVALLFYRSVKNFEYSHLIFAGVFAFCCILISFLILPAIWDGIRYYFIKKYHIRFEELDFS